MNIFLYCIIFIIGILFGSFYTLAVYRIPNKEDIIHTHSYCPNCNAKLGFFELIPILSYIFLRGKCKHCGEKIRIRYLFLEVLSGITFVLVALGLHLDIYSLNLSCILSLIFAYLYITCIFIIAGIDLEKRKIQKNVLYYGLFVVMAYMVYLYIIEHTSIYRYVIYLFIMIILMFIDGKSSMKHAENSYTIGILLLILLMTIFTGEATMIYTFIITCLATALYIVLRKIKYAKSRVKKPDNLSKELRLGCILCSTNIITLIAILNI